MLISGKGKKTLRKGGGKNAYKRREKTTKKDSKEGSGW